MKRMTASFTLVSLTVFALAGLAGTAGAAEPERFHDEFDFAFTNPAGTLCSFRVRLNIHIVDDSVTYVDDSGSVIRIVDHIRSRITFTNVATGTSVVAIGSYSVISYPAAGSVRQGLTDRVVDANGHTLFTTAGLVRLDKNFNEVFVTPHASSAGFQAALCGALS
jgi:hypothetical protein